MDKLTFLKDVVESWKCKLELDVGEWRGGGRGGGVKSCMNQIQDSIGKETKGGAPSEKDRQTE